MYQRMYLLGSHLVWDKLREICFFLFAALVEFTNFPNYSLSSKKYLRIETGCCLNEM
jgi:hypothetical protein